ncbi:MAG: polysaccharide deacetylase family protein [Desulfobacteraceae bacterium]|nr:polysaccharide deacetylase family protein [Desulfobacteraceae bacterium]
MESIFLSLLAVIALIFIPAHDLRGADVSPTATTPADLQGSIREVRVAGDRKLAALTFDLCEGPRERAGFDANLVAFLVENDVKATFFAGGKWMRSHPEETLQLMASPGFEIGTHGWDHANFRRFSKAEAEEQIARTNAQYAALRDELSARVKREGGAEDRLSAIPHTPRLFRFPYGACSEESLRVVAEAGMAAIQWSVVSGDPAPGRTSAGIVNTVLGGIKPGSILIFHANGKGHGTLGALRELLPKLGKQGYGFVTVSELLASGEPFSVPECYEMTPGDTARYDRLGKPKKPHPAEVSE